KQTLLGATGRSALCQHKGCVLRNRGALLAAVRIGIDFSELCPKQKYLSRIVNPQEKHYQRARGSEARSNCTASDVPAYERFSDGEQDPGHNSADHHVAPFEIPVG